MESRQICTSIQAEKTALNRITLKWNTPEQFSAASVAIFRSASPIVQSTISAEKPVAEVPARTTTYTDELKKYGSYYYAVIARDKNGTLVADIFPTVNTTAKAVSLAPPEQQPETPEEELYSPGFLRNLPLPFLAVIDDLGVKPTPMSTAALEAGRTLAQNYAEKSPKLLAPYIFEEDLVCKADGDDYYLFQSLKTYFIQNDYAGSAADLRKLLSVSRTPEVTTRAVFYLAESQYYCRRYREALSLFLFLEDELPELSRKWIDSTLDFYAVPADS